MPRPRPHCVEWGTQLPPAKKGTQPPIFSPCLLWPNCWMDQDATWYGARPRPRRHCVRWGPCSPLTRGTAPTSRPISVVAKRLDRSRCYEGSLGPGHIVLDRDPAPHARKTGPSPNFRPMFIVAERSSISATAEHLYKLSPNNLKVKRQPGHL